MSEQEMVGLVCNDAELIEYFVQLIKSIEKFNLKAIWCPNAERSIQLAADNDVPSVSHTAFQLISRADTHTVIITGHPNHSALFCVQAQASKKKVICLGAVALSVHTAQLLNEFSLRCAGSSILNIIYPLKYSKPFTLLRANIGKIGPLHSISVESTFETCIVDKERLCYNTYTMLHKQGHQLLDAVSSICSQPPRRIAVTHRERSSVVDHFRLRELISAHLQIGFGSVVASFRISASSVDSLMIRVRGENGAFQMDNRVLVFERYEGRSVLWQGDGSFESILKDGTANALLTDCPIPGPSELSLVQCLV